ncbi:MAG TPA: UDP-N-acetyl glucosamine 2-epimerase, partial [Verrucomicrobiae bacterium]|nr:UDP-N-acetyl glucosamine 2-epimerase [Verrucomicrobiae bacterium]
SKMDDLLGRLKPDRLLILGDTNSGLAALVAARRGIEVYHLEAGNRCYDNRVPEEVNRRVIDHCSDVLLPYTHRSAANLVAEGIRRERVFVVGNPIAEVLEHFTPEIEKSAVLARLGLRPKDYFVATMHRAENVDHPGRLRSLVDGLTRLAAHFDKPVIVSVHPRTADKIARSGLQVDSTRVRLEKPLGLFDFIHLEKCAFGVVTDSGTVQEEACIFNLPNVTIRDVTERPETTECGSNILAGASADRLVEGMKFAQAHGSWLAPEEYARRNVAATVGRILLSHRH